MQIKLQHSGRNTCKGSLQAILGAYLADGWQLVEVEVSREEIAQAIHDGPGAQEQYRNAGIPPHPWGTCPYQAQYLRDADAVADLLEKL